MARELPALIERLHEPLGEVVDISINWTALQGVPNLDQLGRSGTVLLPGQEARPHRVMTVTGSRARAHLLIVPSGLLAVRALIPNDVLEEYRARADELSAPKR